LQQATLKKAGIASFDQHPVLRRLQNLQFTGRFSDLLRPSDAFPFLFWMKQWHIAKRALELTAAGTVADFHDIPF
jgi:hypothetical protein